MNRGKICVSVCAETADEILQQIRDAEELADVIEVRFDCLRPTQIVTLLNVLKREFDSDTDRLLATFRSKEQGGFRTLTDDERNSFWNGADMPFWSADFEEDIIGDSFSRHLKKKICSFHDFSGVPKNLEEIYERLRKTDADVIKIAVQADDITDTIPIWKLLERAKSDNMSFIPIAMGEAGKWTRILGLAHGAFMTYASLGEGTETAPGQTTAADMRDVYRVKELDAKTDVYGIIAGDSSYSVSPFMHNAAFKTRGLNSVFVPLQTRDLNEFMKRMVKSETREFELNFKGFAVTNPHKQSIIKYLDDVDETARDIGAVNTVKVENGKFYGYNTDASGFIEPLRKQFGVLSGARVAVIGAGGAARACIYALKNEGADVSIFARDPHKAQKLGNEFNITVRQLTTDHRPLSTDFDIIVNATPIGTKGLLQNETIAMADQLKNVKLVYDLTYNPSETRLIHEARQAGVPTLGGLEMLTAQGAKQFELWTGKTAPVDEMSAAVKKRLRL